MKMLKMVMVLIFCVNIISAQVDSTLEYFPFHVGDTWQYDTYHGYYTVVVGKDTLMPNGKIYRYMGNFGEKYGYYRIDTITACVYNYINYDTTEIITDSLKAKIEDEWGEYRYLCVDVYLDTIFSMVTSVKVFCDRGIIPGMPCSHYAKGFGLVHYTWAEEHPNWPLINTYTADLVYAKINGREYGTMVSVDKNENTLPQKFFLSQNYPNPFNPTTTISFKIPVGTYNYTSLRVYDLLGREVATLVNEKLPPGTHTRQWDASGLTSGVYFYRLSANGYSETKKLVLMK